MATLDNFANSSNEAKQQRMLRLQSDFRHKRIITIESAMHQTGLSRKTIENYCRTQNIPLIDSQVGRPIVELTDSNRPDWLK